ncbi:MAG: APC family permease, partial [Halieaceae bacterium]|nr:APC family permease [Halieaceae bacterium]
GALKGLFLVLITTPFWYSGFNTMPQAIGEVADLRNPMMLAKIVASTFIAGGVFYASVILATALAAPRDVLVNAEMGVASAIEYAFNSFWMGKLVLFTGLLGLLTTWNAVFFSAARVLFALGRARLIYPSFSNTHPKYGSPHVAVLTVGLLCIGGCLAGRPALIIAINTAALSFSLVYLLACCAFMRLRQRSPELKRPYKMPGYPYLVIIAIVVCSLMVICSLYFTWIERQTLIPVEWLLMLFWILAGVLVWFGSGRVRRDISESERRALMHTR